VSAGKMVLIKVLCGIFSCFAALALNIFVVSKVESRLGIYSSTLQIILLVAQLVVIYVFSQLILFKKLTRVEIVLLSAAYGISTISVLFLRYSAIDMYGIFRLSPNIIPGHLNWNFSLNPISFIFDGAADPSSILVSLLNIFLFLPLKPILSANKLHPKWWIVIAGFFVIELLQYLLNAGSFDLGDIVLYFAGYLAGHGIVKIYLDKAGKARKQSRSRGNHSHSQNIRNA